MLMTKPIIEKGSMDKSDILLDFGIYAYVTGGTKEKIAEFFISSGVTAGRFNGFISVSFSPTFVISNERSDWYLGVIFTSDSLKF